MVTGDDPGGKSATLLERAGTKASRVGEIGKGNPRLRLGLQWGLAGLIFAFLVFFVIRQWNQIPADFEWHFEPAWLVLSVVGVFGLYFFQGEIWRLMVHSLGESHLRARPARAVWGKSLLARYVPTNALMVVGRMVMAEKEGVPKRVCLASIAYELVLGFGTAVMVGAYFVIELPDLEGQPARYAVLLLIPIVLVFLHPRVFAPLANFGLRKLGREALPQVLSFPQVLRFSLMYIGCWAVIGVGVYAFARALTPLPASDFPYVAAAYPVAFCVAVLTFIVPSGLGTRDAALAVALSAVLDDTVATAIAVGFRIFQTAIELAYVGLVVAMDRRSSAAAPARDTAASPPAGANR
jgi:glycosyltransferase 2 family protein